MANLKEKVYRYIKLKQFNRSNPAPPFDIWKPINDVIPETYNSEGRRYEYYYLRDIHSAANPYGDTGKYYIWERYNYGLPIHFYSHMEMFTKIGKPEKKYGMLVESRAIVPDDYATILKKKGFEKDFEKIFTFDDEILQKFDNAAYVPFSSSPWYGRNNDLIYDSNNYEKKEKGISFLSSDKAMTRIHKVRIATARYCQTNGLCDVYGKVVGSKYVAIEEPLKKYRYSFAIENIQTDYYFTEKITNCFAAQTIPIYYGARKISDYFNLDGIIVITEEDFDNIETILKQCTKEEYERRLPAIIENYNRVIGNYMNMQDYLYENYIMDF